MNPENHEPYTTADFEAKRNEFIRKEFQQRKELAKGSDTEIKQIIRVLSIEYGLCERRIQQIIYD